MEFWKIIQILESWKINFKNWNFGKLNLENGILESYFENEILENYFENGVSEN